MNKKFLMDEFMWDRRKEKSLKQLNRAMMKLVKAGILKIKNVPIEGGAWKTKNTNNKKMITDKEKGAL